MIAIRSSPIFYIALSCLALGDSHCFADYIGHVPFVPYGVVRIQDDGTLTSINYISSIPTSIRMNIESFGQEAAVTPDLKKVYQFTNSLGFSDLIASDANTGQYLPNDSIYSWNPPGSSNAYIFQAKQPLITPSNELFVLSLINSGSNSSAWQVKHFDLNTKTFIEAIDPPTPQVIDDVAFRASGAPLGVGDQLYFSTPSGIYVEQRTSPVSEAFGSLFSFLPPLVPGVDGNIAIGPDNRLYVRNFANGDVQRYTLTGQFIDTLISHTSFPNLGTIQFGVDGNLHVYQSLPFNPSMPTAYANILTFSPLTGSLLWTAPNTFMYPGRVTFVPVPEPSTLMLISAFAICAGACNRTTRRQD